MKITRENYFENRECMKNQLSKLDLAIDTVLKLQGFEHDNQKGWIGEAQDYNEWIECVLEFESDIEKQFQSFEEVEINIAQFYSLVEFAEIDILKNICKVYK